MLNDSSLITIGLVTNLVTGCGLSGYVYTLTKRLSWVHPYRFLRFLLQVFTWYPNAPLFSSLFQYSLPCTPNLIARLLISTCPQSTHEISSISSSQGDKSIPHEPFLLPSLSESVSIGILIVFHIERQSSTAVHRAPVSVLCALAPSSRASGKGAGG